MLNHGINIHKNDAKFIDTQKTSSGIPFYVGAWPCHMAGGYTGKPQLATSFEDAKKLGGYSEEWRDSDGSPKWSLCQAMYSHFSLFGMSPAIFFNVFDPASHKTAVSETAHDVVDKTVTLPGTAIDDSGLTVKDIETLLEKGTDYETAYIDGNLIITLLSGSTHYSATSLTVGYNAADPSQITEEDISAAFESIESCKGSLGIIPDLLCAPGWSQTPTVASVMATKAANVNGLFKSKAVVDLDSASGKVTSYDEIAEYKATNGYTDNAEIVCWPLAKVGEKVFDMSVIVCGTIARTDEGNGGLPFESPSNKKIPITGLVTADGEDVILTLNEADIVSYTCGVVTAIPFNGWRLWGNYTGDKKFICCDRMIDFIGKEFVNRYMDYVDRPLTRVVIDAILNDFNAFLAGLTKNNALYGGEMVYIEDNNPREDLLSGKFRLDCKQASPVPAQQIDAYIEYDVTLLDAALNV